MTDSTIAERRSRSKGGSPVIEGDTVSDNASTGIYYGADEALGAIDVEKNRSAPTGATASTSTPGSPPDISTNRLSANDENGIWLRGRGRPVDGLAGHGYAIVTQTEGVIVGEGATLTLEPGTVDTNGDGESTSPSAGDWGGVFG